ncbi:hypothetical protein M3194_15800 [Paenibacillus glycanilyticus]|uniref:DUF4376 domain-containing protein n=1 Tax=Paenibacillus glycanilyticus TaxID=126569 RepID=UPI00203B6BFE|nr:hypothetical protein [Paenibacillus glycanilyticus]MCM3628808.1 hypothetical protein [Paenibacillus glycanilyticus]
MDELLEIFISQGLITQDQFDQKVAQYKAEIDARPKNPDEIFLSLDVENTDIEVLREKKIEQLDYLCNQSILAGFESDSLGESHKYDFDTEAQGNLSGTLNLINGGQLPSDTILEWKADGIPQNHTVPQFIQVCVDSFTHKQSNVNKYWEKKYAVLEMIEKEDILSVNWVGGE